MRILYGTILGATVAAATAAAGECARGGVRAEALDARTWDCSEWISAKDAPVFEGKVVDGSTRAADGTSWFAFTLTNADEVVSAKWMTAGLGVFEVYVNGRPVGDDFLKPGSTHNAKTKYAFTYDVIGLLDASAGGVNVFAAEVSAGWWRDKICTPANDGGGFFGRKSAFRGVLELVFKDGRRRLYGTDAKTWRAGTSGPVTHAGIYDGEECDARCPSPLEDVGRLDEAERNDEFKGRIFPSEGAEVCLRRDLAMPPREAYVWRETTGADGTNAFGKVVKARIYEDGQTMRIAKGEKLVLDFGQNAAAVPEFRFRAKEGTVLTALPAEMLNDGNGAKSRGNDGPEGSVYRVNLRKGHENGRLVKYTFSGRGEERYWPRFTFFGYRYLSVSATDDVEIESVRSVPVTSIRKDMELGRIETGFAPLNRFIRNVYWGQLSNYLSVPTDCPQRDERLGWTADTQVFCEAGSFNADTRSFFGKWMRDMRDSQHEKGGFPGVAPLMQYGGECMRHGWADAGVVVPYVIWLQFASSSIVDENWIAMERFLARVAETKYRTEKLPECGMYQWNDWLSLAKYESCPYRPELSAFAKGPDGRMHPTPEALKYWDYLGGCHWLADARMMATMAAATGRTADAEKYRAMAAEAEAYLRTTFFATPDGRIAEFLRDMQTPLLFALRLGLVDGAAKARTLADLKASLAAGGGTLHTGFLGTTIALDTLTANGLSELAYDLMLNRKFPGWLYSVDQGATTVWERWNSYTKDKGFGPVGMNSFNHYAYGCVLAWLYKTVAGIAADPQAPGYRNVIMAPRPDRRLGWVKAEYRSAAGLVKSAWRYEGDKWIWDFTVPEGATATVSLPDGSPATTYSAGTYHVELALRADATREAGSSVEPEKLDFGPFELANPDREARVKLGPDEPDEVRKAVADMLSEVEAKTGVKVKYSTWSSPVGGDIFVSTQPWAAKGAWFVKLKNNIVAIHGSDFEGTRKAVEAFRAQFLSPAKDGRGLSWAAIDVKEGPQPDDVFDAELRRVETLRKGNRDWENECVTERNRLPARADGFPLARAEDALVDGEVRTPWVKSLDGRWKFCWNGSPKSRPLDFFKADFDDSDWLEIDVPSCVEMKGFGSPGYVNITYPHKNDPPFVGDDYNPVSSYRTTFTVPPEWKGRRVVLRFNGVYSAYYVWVNGRKVGYAEDSCLPSEFDVTECLNGGSNCLAVEVYRWSDGSYLEDQDFMRFSGIYRGVSIWAEPKNPIRDYFVTTEVADDLSSAVVRVKVDCDVPVSATLYDADKKPVGRCDARLSTLDFQLSAPDLWSAESPYLYTLVLTAGDDIRSCKVGVRSVRLAPNGEILVNGKSVKFKGVNRHDASPVNGRAVTRAEMEEDVRLMKRGNFDTLRTSHYPNDPYLFDLCDRYGLYVQCEANVESHGSRYGVKSLAYPPSWAKSQVERCTRMVAFYKNHPSVYLWSLGNEAGTGHNFELAHRAMLELDGTRLYMNRNDNENFKIHGHGYLSFDEMERVAKWCPFHMSEYAHCMGNALGNFREYWDVFRANPALSGGCVWDWYDQTVRVETDRIGPDGRRVAYWAYGGDWDEYPNDANFCVNGLIGPERKVSPKLVEAAHVQQDVEVVCEDAAKGEATLVNRAAFTFADAYDGEWALFADGVKVDGGALEVPHVAPQSSGAIRLPRPSRMPDATAERFYRVAFKLKAGTPWAPKGWEVAHDQLPYGRYAGNAAENVSRSDAEVQAVGIVARDGEIVVSAGPTKAVFSRATGTLSLLEMYGKTILRDEQGVSRGPRLTCRRAFTDNDDGVRKRFIASGLTQLRHHAHPAKASRLADGTVEIGCRVDVTGSKSAAFAHEARWLFFADGRVSVESVSTPRGDMPQLPRLGLSMALDGALEQVRYYGRGPWENYVDRCTASDIAYWESTVTDLYVEYARPQDNGYRTDVRWVAFLDADGDGVLCKGSVPLCVQALHYSVDELDLQRHRGAGTWGNGSKERFYAPMFPRREVLVNLDIRQLGLGNGSCGPAALECYSFPNRREEWTVTFVPVKGGDGGALRSAARRVEQKIPDKAAVRSRRASGRGFDGG